MAIRVINDNKLNDIAVAIQAKDNGGQMTVDQMVGRIEAISTGAPVVVNPAFVLWDWEGTKLAEYSREDALALTELPAPSALPTYAAVDHELLVFQEWNWSLADIKAWVQGHRNAALDVGAIYTTTDGQNHNYWNSPRLDTATTICMQKRGETSIDAEALLGNTSLVKISLSDGVTSVGVSAFQRCHSLAQVIIPNGVTSISDKAFNVCYALSKILLPNSITSIGTNAFSGCFSLTEINTPHQLTSIGTNAFSGCYSLTKFHIPKTVTSVGSGAFNSCTTLCDVLNESKSTLSNTSAFGELPSLYRIYVPRENLSWFETATNWSAIYTQGHIVAIEDYIEYLESLGFDVDKYKEAA